MNGVLIYDPGGRLSETELRAARLDGHVFEVGAAYMPADTVEGADARAAGLHALIVFGTALSGPTAAWVHGAGDQPPSRHHLHRAARRRIRVAPEPFVVFHDVAVPEEDLMLIGGMPVTTSQRTMFDLLLGAHRHPEQEHWARALHGVHPLSTRAAAERLAARTRIPGRRSALRLVRALVQEDDTR